MTVRANVLSVLCLCFSAFSVTPVEAVDLSVKEFMAQEETWNKLENQSLRIEGRYLSVGKRIIRFENCSAVFKATRDLSRPQRRTRTIEVTGQLVPQGTRHVFEIAGYRELPSDEERFRRELSRIREGEFAKIESVCRWAVDRGRFYDDNEMVASARNRYQSELERLRAKTPDQPEFLLDLATRAWKFGVEESYVDELRHAAYAQQWKTLDLAEPDMRQLEALGRTIRKELTDADKPLTSSNEKTVTAYLRNPIAAYVKGNSKSRLAMHRMLHNAVWMKRILAIATPNGSNGDAVADLFEKNLPEHRDLALQFRNRKLEYDASRVAALTRNEMLDVSQQFAERDDAARAESVRRDWLKSREKPLRDRGTSGLIELARGYVDLLDDREAAARLLFQAHDDNPDSAALVKAFQDLGYRQVDGQWIAAAELGKQRKRKRGPIVGVRVGMTELEVNRQLGAPDSIARTATAGLVTELWIYGQRGTNRTVIQLTRSKADDTARVIKVNNVRPR